MEYVLIVALVAVALIGVLLLFRGSIVNDLFHPAQNRIESVTPGEGRGSSGPGGTPPGQGGENPGHGGTPPGRGRPGS